MTPAEKLSSKKKPRKSNEFLATRNVVWVCKINEVRKSLNLSLQDVADALGTTITTIHSIERGTNPVLTTAVKIAQFFGKTVEELWPELR